MRPLHRYLIAGALTTAVASASATLTARGVLKHQAARARAVIGQQPLGEVAFDADRVYKRSLGSPVDLLLLGDSIAAGLGADSPRGTLGARLARKLARRTDRAVRLRTAAVVGAESSMLGDQLAALPDGYVPDVTVIVVGGNDVTHRVPVQVSVAHLHDCVEALRTAGSAVVVGTCPDLGALRPVPQPLRSLGSRASRQLAAAQRATALAAGAYVVSLADVVGPFFITNPDEMFSLDRFHPSTLGYKRTANAVLPSVVAALQEHDDVPFGHVAPRLRSVGS